MTKRYEECFSSLKEKGQGAFIPYVTLGDPDPGQSLEILRTLCRNGADALELGLPFSDPGADGPVLQVAAQRALNAGTEISDCFELITQLRKEEPRIPIGLLVYANLVVAPGKEAFYIMCAGAGVDSVLIADVPLEESEPFCRAAGKAGIAPVFIAAPNTARPELQLLAERCQAYTYVLSRGGITGTESASGVPPADVMQALHDYGAPPAVIGFGISRPQHVRRALETGAAGAISGSAVVKIIAAHLDSPVRMLSALGAFVAEMKAATNSV